MIYFSLKYLEYIKTFQTSNTPLHWGKKHCFTSLVEDNYKPTYILGLGGSLPIYLKITSRVSDSGFFVVHVVSSQICNGEKNKIILPVQ